MTTETPDRKVNTGAKIHNDGAKRLPNERDESPEGQDKPTRGVMRQAADDLARGLVDTDLHGERGAEAAVPGATTGTAQAQPRGDASHGMRDSTNPTHGNPTTSGKDKQ